MNSISKTIRIMGIGTTCRMRMRNPRSDTVNFNNCKFVICTDESSTEFNRVLRLTIGFSDFVLLFVLPFVVVAAGASVVCVPTEVCLFVD